MISRLPVPPSVPFADAELPIEWDNDGALSDYRAPVKKKRWQRAAEDLLPEVQVGGEAVDGGVLARINHRQIAELHKRNGPLRERALEGTDLGDVFSVSASIASRLSQRADDPLRDSLVQEALGAL